MTRACWSPRSGGRGYTNGLLFGAGQQSNGSDLGIATGGTVIGLAASSKVLRAGVDLSGGGFSSFAIAAPGFLVDGAGTLTVNALAVTSADGAVAMQTPPAGQTRLSSGDGTIAGQGSPLSGDIDQGIRGKQKTIRTGDDGTWQLRNNADTGAIIQVTDAGQVSFGGTVILPVGTPGFGRVPVQQRPNRGRCDVRLHVRRTQLMDRVSNGAAW